MDRPVLHTFVDQVRANERFKQLAGALPSRARVSEPLLPLLLAALHEELERPLVCLLPDDGDARDAAEAAGWFLGASTSRFFPAAASAGDPASSRPRTSSASGPGRSKCSQRGGLVCASALALAEGAPAAGRRAPRRSALAIGDEPGFEGSPSGSRSPATNGSSGSRSAASSPCAAGSSTSFRQPAASRCASSSSATRSRASAPSRRSRSARSGPCETATIYPAAERRLDLIEPTPDDDAPPPLPDDLVPPLDRAPRPRLASPTRWRDLGGGARTSRLASPARPSSSRCPRASPSPSRLSALRSRRADWRRRRTSSQGFVRGGNRVVVAFPHRGEALRTQNMLRRIEARAARRRATTSLAIRSSCSPSRPPVAASSGASSASSLLPDTQVFRKRPPARRRASRPRAPVVRRPAHRRLRRPRGPRRREAARLRDPQVAEVTRDYLLLAFSGDDRLYVPHEQIGKVSRYIGADARAPALSKLGGKAWQLIKITRARQRPRAGRRAARALRAPPERARRRLRPLAATGWSGSRPSSRTARPRTSSARSRRSRTTSRRRARWTGSSAATSASARPRWRFAPPSPVALNGKQTLMLVPTTVLAQQHWNTFRERYRDFPIRVEMVSRFRTPAERKRSLADFAEGQGRRPDRHAPAALARRDPEEPRPRDRRRGAALRRRAEGAAPLAAARGRRARAHRDADPAHAAHVALRPARHLGHRDAAGGPAPDPHARGRVRRGADQDGARARARARRPVLLPPQPRRDDRGGRRASCSSSCPDLRFLVAHGQMRERELEERMLALPARRRRRARLDDDHRVGPRHPAGEHADRRARRPARPGPALPDPRPRRPLATCPRTPTSSIPTRRS